MFEYKTTSNVWNFNFWSGAKDIYDRLTYDELDILEEAIENYVEITWDSKQEVPTDTEINDLLWFYWDEYFHEEYKLPSQDEIIERPTRSEQIAAK